MRRGPKPNPEYWSTVKGQHLRQLRHSFALSGREFGEAMGWGSDADRVFRYEDLQFLPKRIADQIANLDDVKGMIISFLLVQELENHKNALARIARRCQ